MEREDHKDVLAHKEQLDQLEIPVQLYVTILFLLNHGNLFHLDPQGGWILQSKMGLVILPMCFKMIHNFGPRPPLRREILIFLLIFSESTAFLNKRTSLAIL